VKVSVAFPPSEGPDAKKFPTVEIGGAVLVGKAALGVLAASISPPEVVPIVPKVPFEVGVAPAFSDRSGDPVVPVNSTSAAFAIFGTARTAPAAIARQITLFFNIASSQNE
jgi:hypothetical protein